MKALLLSLVVLGPAQADDTEVDASAVISALSAADVEPDIRVLLDARLLRDAQRQLVPLLEVHIESKDARVRRAAALALGGLTPTSIPVMIAALDHADAEVRRASAEGIAHALYPYSNQREAHVRRDFDFWKPGYKSTIVWDASHDWIARNGVAALAAALEDPDEYVRAPVALALYELGADAAPARDALARAGGDPSASVRLWAERAVARLDGGPWSLVRKLAPAAAAEPLTEEQVAAAVELVRQESPWDWRREGTKTLRLPPEPDARFEAALLLARHRLDLLSADAASDDSARAAEASAVLARMDYVARSHVRILLDVYDNTAFWAPARGVPPAGDELVRLGAPILEEIAGEFLRYPRFPIGPASFTDYVPLLLLLEESGLPVAALALDHWDPAPGVYTAAQVLVELGEGAAPTLPFVVAAWRTAPHPAPRDQDTSVWDRQVSELSADANWDWWPELAVADHDLVESLMHAVGPAAVPHMLRALEDDLPRVRARACRGLGAVGVDTEEVRDALLAAVRDTDPSVQASAERGLLLLGRNK